MRSATIGTNEMAQTRKVRKGESMRLFGTTGLRRKITGLLKGTLILTACLSMSAGMFPAGASAAETIDLTRRGSLSITFTSNGEPISDGNEVGIYRVADIVVDNGYKFVPTGDFVLWSSQTWSPACTWSHIRRSLRSPQRTRREKSIRSILSSYRSRRTTMGN